MPCPFATGFQIAYASLGEAIALTATAPLYRWAVLQQTTPSAAAIMIGSIGTTAGTILELDNHNNNNNHSINNTNIASLWQGNGMVIAYTALFQSLSLYLQRFLLEQYDRYHPSSAAAAAAATNDQDDGDSDDDDDQERNNNVPKAAVQFWAGGISLLVWHPLQVIVTQTLVGAESKPHDRNGSSSGKWVRLYQGVGLALLGYVQREVMLWRNHNWVLEGRWSGTLSSIVTLVASYPLDTASRRAQLRSGLDDHHDWYAGCGLHVLHHVAYQGILAALNAEACQEAFRRLVMKFFH